jgi:transposase
MALHVAVPMRYIHERHFGRPACPKCGELERVSAGLNRRIPEGLWMSESSGIDSIFGGGSIPKPCSLDLRERVLETVESGASRGEAAERFEVSASSAIKWMQRWHETGSVAAKPSGGNISPLEEHADFLLALIAEQPAPQPRWQISYEVRSALRRHEDAQALLKLKKVEFAFVPGDGFSIVASSKFPMFGSPLRLNASAPALAGSRSTGNNTLRIRHSTSVKSPRLKAASSNPQP